MGFKDVLSIVTSQAASQHVIDMAEQLAEQDTARLSTLVVQWLPSAPYAGDIWVADPWWGEMVADAQRRLEAEAALMRQAFDRRVGQADVEAALLEPGMSRAYTGMRARHADISIVSRPEMFGDLASTLLSGPLFDAGRPVLVVPPKWRRRRIGQSVLVCWKPTREAARALGDADTFLASAARISVVTVDAKPSEEGYGPQPGADISAHLARRGHTIELFNVDSTGRSEVQAILDQATAVDADMIVMGGFGRSRMSEFIFGGVTREMLKSSPVPMLMSH